MNAKHWLSATLGLGVIAMFCGTAWHTAAAAPTRFDGYRTTFNLGRSGKSNLVCAATRAYDDPIGTRARTWDITCRGLGAEVQGVIYVFHGASRERLAADWVRGLTGRYDCGVDAGGRLSRSILAEPKTAECKASGDGAQTYELLTRPSGQNVVAVFGKSGIVDLLGVGLDYASGRIDEPAAVAKVVSSVSELSSVDAASSSSPKDTQAQLRRAYQDNYDWAFEQAEERFSSLVGPSQSESATQVRALYNVALNASNQGQAEAADIIFKQAEDEAARTCMKDAFASVALNYEALLERNKGAIDRRNFETARTAALKAVALRREAPAGGVLANGCGGLQVVTGERETERGRLTAAQTNALLDAQAYQIAATSMEQLGQTADAADLLDKSALPLLNTDWISLGGGKSRKLGEAVPWLNLRIRADALRLDRLAGRPVDLVGFRDALTSFARTYPASLPLASYTIELAAAEAATKGQEDNALRDYQTAFDIFRDKRGALGPSADLVGGYFDILLARIDGKPASHPNELAQFFEGAQTLISQSSAEAAKRADSRRVAGGAEAGIAARELETSQRDLVAIKAAIRTAESRGDAAFVKQADVQRVSLEQEVAGWRSRLETLDPGYAARLRRAITLDELKASLKDGEIYLKAFTLPRFGYGIAVTHDVATPYKIDLTRAALRCLIERYRSSMEPKATFDPGCDAKRTREVDETSLFRFDIDAASSLFEAVFGPVKSQVLAAKLMIYEPDATLIGAPVSAMVVDKAVSLTAMRANEAALAAQVAKAASSNSDDDVGPRLSYVGVDWLGAHLPSSVALDPFTFTQLRALPASKAPRPFLGFGNPIIYKDADKYKNIGGGSDSCKAGREHLASTLRPLSGTADEVVNIAKSLDGPGTNAYRLAEAFNDTDIESSGAKTGSLQQYRVLYFATHGLLHPHDPCLGVSLVTSLGPDPHSSALLDQEHIGKLYLDADMVVLAACNTGINQDGGNEALGGLVENFETAGARNLVVSNWSVDSGSTTRLMTYMFQLAGHPQAAALAESEAQIRRDPTLSHPFYWAGFTIVGDAARSIPDRAASAPSVTASIQ